MLTNFRNSFTVRLSGKFATSGEVMSKSLVSCCCWLTVYIILIIIIIIIIINRCVQRRKVVTSEALYPACGRYFQPYSIGGSSDAAFRYRYYGNLIVLIVIDALAQRSFELCGPMDWYVTKLSRHSGVSCITWLVNTIDPRCVHWAPYCSSVIFITMLLWMRSS